MPAQKEIGVISNRPEIKAANAVATSCQAKTVTPVPAYRHLSQWEKALKRLMDVLFSTIAFIVLLPLILYTAIRTACSGKGKIIYSQQRVGYKGRPFQILKFRSMVPDAEINGPRLSSENDERVTSWGKVMRRWRLDELPQLWNILKGDMSLVGPRPERRFYIDIITKTHPQYRTLLRVKPGLTGWGMVKFGYAENVTQMKERLQYDLEYIQNLSIVLDLKILAHTVRTILLGNGK